MSLSDGDYIAITGHIVAAIEADTGEGGLNETGCPAVNTVESRLRDDHRAYRNCELPALAVTVTAKDERREAGASVRTYRVAFLVLCRGLDSAAELDRCERIAHRLEELLREENDPDRQLGNLPAALPWSIGALSITPRLTEFMSETSKEAQVQQFVVLGVVDAEIEIPATNY